jgi:hypothetical protein
MATDIVEGFSGERLLALAALLGRSGKIIESEISGTSMGGALPPGCRIRIRPVSVNSYEPGQVVAFVTGNVLYAHRIVSWNRQGVLTRGDNHLLCDLPLPFHAILGLVTECRLHEEWRPLPERTTFNCKRRLIARFVGFLVRMCMSIDVRLAQHVSRTLMWLARWRHLHRPDGVVK